MAQLDLSHDECDVIVYFPPGFSEQLEALRLSIESRAIENRGDHTTGVPPPPPRPQVFYKSTRDESQLARGQVQFLLDRWESKIVRGNLLAGNMPVEVTQPFDIEPQDIATKEQSQAALWSKLLPFIVFICALTGAFYPAVDLCAGEKERGTLETLLTCPAQRSEIVLGKLLTVITFSIGSALCNLGSMALTGHLILRQLSSSGLIGDATALAPPSLSAIGWLLLALLPMAAFFSAASLALAALARSTKEGQYYLMPMFLVCMPLMLMPMSPGIELNLPTSLLPITGMVLLMRAAMEGDLYLAATYVVPVLLVTGACCLLAIIWAIDQFKQESILFRDTENVSLWAWARYAYRNRPATPTLGAAAVCIPLIFLSQFGMQSLGLSLQTAADFIQIILLSQAAIFLPVVLLTWLCVRSPVQTFLLLGSRSFQPTKALLGIPLAFLLAVVMIPLGTQFLEETVKVIPFSGDLETAAKALGDIQIPLALALLLMALLPAIVEEIAFRGFILTGLRRRIPDSFAIILTAIFFGLAHSNAVQQTISATLLGLVLGFIAVKTANITPCIVFHMGYNGLHLLRARFGKSLMEGPLGDSLLRETDNPLVIGIGFTAPVVALCGLLALLLLLLLWFVGRIGPTSTDNVRITRAASSHLPTSTPAEKSRA